MHSSDLFLVSWNHFYRFCYMKPFNGSCSVPEEKVEDGVVTISTKRSGYNCTKDLENKDRSSKESPESKS